MLLQPNNFEFGSAFKVNSRERLENYLQRVWLQYRQLNGAEVDGEDLPNRQRFLSFDGNLARARNFIGFIQGDEDDIQIYPKVFRDSGVSADAMIRHLFFWFDYCRKWKFPFSDVQLDTLENVDLPELIINLISGKLLEVITTSPISLYEPMEESLMMPRGVLNFNRYLVNSLSKGFDHQLECDTEPLLFDNRLNRAIKYVARVLLTRAKFRETTKKLDEIIFILDEVEDCFCTSRSLDGVKLNPFYSDYHMVIGLCRMVLDQQIYSNNHEQHSHWCLLLPMEYVFEDFIAGFLIRHFSDKWIVEYQKSEMYLTDQKVFRMQHDIFLTSRSSPEIQIIVDTKYKLRGDYKSDRKRGVDQSDLYQMTSYAIRRGCKNVLLLYPNQSDIESEEDLFSISGHPGEMKIDVYAAEIPFWSPENTAVITAKLKDRLGSLLMNFL
ncbi:MAG: restriction endonuclease [Chitinophagaceae bacterium]|nr:MAG: restriction endonuclease [Chitinophagaceae bacterium]